MTISCQLCQQYLTGVKLIGKGRNIVQNLLSHAKIHGQHLQIINGYSMSDEDLLKKCFPNYIPSGADVKKKRPLKTACRELFSKLGLLKSRKPVYCKICNGTVQVFQKHSKGEPIFISDFAIGHACRHLGIEPYACRHCDAKSSTGRCIGLHIYRDHGGSATANDFIDSVNSYHDRIIQMLKQCFGKSTDQAEPGMLGSKDLEPLKLISPFYHQCRALASRANEKGELQCSQCCAMKKILHDAELRVSSTMDHACVHLGKALYSCRQCDSHFASQCAIRKHLSKCHGLSATIHNYIDKSSEYQQDIMDMFKICYGKKAENQQSAIGPRGKPRQKIHSSVRNIKCPISNACYEVYMKCGRQDIMSCGACGKSMTVKRQGGFTTCVLTDHVYIHLGNKDLFECKQCRHKCATVGAIDSHVRKIHKLSGGKSLNYIDHSADYANEIIETIQRCFGQQPDPKVKTEPEPVSLTSCYNRSKWSDLTAIRKKHSHLFFKQFVTSNEGRIKCKLCSKTISIATRRQFIAMSAENHAYKHLKKPLYQCRHCSIAKSSPQTIRMHLKLHHPNQSSGDYDDHCDEFHSEIMEMFTKCYGD